MSNASGMVKTMALSHIVEDSALVNHIGGGRVLELGTGEPSFQRGTARNGVRQARRTRRQRAGVESTVSGRLGGGELACWPRCDFLEAGMCVLAMLGDSRVNCADLRNARALQETRKRGNNRQVRCCAVEKQG